MVQRKPKDRKKLAKARKPEKSPKTSRRAARQPEPKATNKSLRANAESNGDPLPLRAEAAAPDFSRFPVVVIGASAGGLAALEPLFAHLPRDSGMAFVVIMHQAPDHSSLLPELLGRYAGLPTQSISDGMSLAPNHLYVTPPGQTLVFKGDLMHLHPVEKQRGGALPIDAAFRSLAHNHAERAIAVVLSGNGSDGAIGVAEVKSSYGMVIAQDPQTAQCTGMPASAISTHVVDYVLAPQHMADQLLRYARSHVPVRAEGADIRQTRRRQRATQNTRRAACAHRQRLQRL